MGNELPRTQQHYLLPCPALWKVCLVFKLNFLFILVLSFSVNVFWVYGLTGYSSVNKFWEESSELPFAMTVLGVRSLTIFSVWDSMLQSQARSQKGL